MPKVGGVSAKILLVLVYWVEAVEAGAFEAGLDGLFSCVHVRSV